MGCSHCGRDDTCVHQVRYSQKEIYPLFLLITVVPSIIIGVLYNITLDLNEINYYFVGGLSLTLILVYLWIMYFFFDKLYIAIFFGCHQKVSRSIKLNGKPLVLCARCSGIHDGIITSIIISLIPFAHWWVLIGLIPMIIDGTIQKFTNYESTNVKRFITGFLAGIAIPIIYGFSYYLLSSFFIRLSVQFIEYIN